MAIVSVSANLTHPHCVQRVKNLQVHWQAELTRMGSRGEFKVGHGADGTCTAVHAAPFDGNFWIWTVPRKCNVFLSEEGNEIDYAGAGRDTTGAYCGTGHCRCGSGH